MNFSMKWSVLYLAVFCLFVFMVQMVTLKEATSSPAPSNDDQDYDEYSDETLKKRKGVGKVSGMCPSLSLTNGRVRFRSRGRIAKFLCRVGFQAFGKRFATCIRGRWNGQPPICISRGCPTFVPPRNGRMSMEYRGALLNFACNPGFTLVGSRSLYCDGTKWNSTAPNCEVSVKNPQLTCDFERDDLCGWSHDPTHDFEWKRFNLVTPSGHVGTGPSHDHTLGEGRDGYYMYIEASSPRVENDTARLFSPVYKATEGLDVCFRFWYHMYGATSGFLRVYVKPASGDFSSLLPKFSVGGDQGNKWHFAFVAISPLTEPFQIVIEGIRGPSYVSDTAIDDVQLAFGSDCVRSEDNSTAVWSTVDGTDASTLSVSTETSEETSNSGEWHSSSFVGSVSSDVSPSTSNPDSSYSPPVSVDLLRTVTPPTTPVPSGSSSVTSIFTDTLSSMASTSTLTSDLYPIRTLLPLKVTSPPFSSTSTSSRYTVPLVISTDVTKTTVMSTTTSRNLFTKTTTDKLTTRPSLSTSVSFRTRPFPTANPAVIAKSTTQTPKVILSTSLKILVKPTELAPPSRAHTFTPLINQWTKVVTSGPLSLKNTTRPTVTTIVSRSTTRSVPKTPTRTPTLTTKMAIRLKVVTPVVETSPLSTEKSNEIEIFPEETETFVENGHKERPPPPWTYMKRPSSVDRESDRAFGNVAAAHVADGQFSVATGVGIGAVFVVAIAILVFLARRIHRRNKGRRDALNEDSDVRYLKDGEVRVEFCDLHLRYIGREDDSGL